MKMWGMNNPPALRAEITQFILQSTEDLARRFFPDFALPAYFAGHRVVAQESADLAYLLTGLKAIGIQEITGQGIDDILLRLLSQVDGPNTETFYSYRVAETLLGLGGLEAALAAGERAGIADGLNRENLVQAVDSTFIYDREARILPRHPNNYWAVLARCELRRRELGLLPADSPFSVCLEKINALFRGNTLGFWDDYRTLEGRYDSYSADVQLFIEPLWPEIDPRIIERNLRAHVRLLESIALENGASVAWGRTIGAHSICMTMELGALALKLGYASDPARMLGLVQVAFDEFKGWFRDGLIAAHRGRMTDGYRGLHRILQMTVDCLGKLAYVAKVLGYVEAPPAAGAVELFPPRDEFIAMREDGLAGVWMFRNERLAFQFPLCSGINSTYMAWLNMPGLFTSPVDSGMICGAPRLIFGDTQYFPSGLPDRVEKTDGQLIVRFSHWRQSGKGNEPGPERIGAVRELELTVSGDTVTGRERWTFETTPDGIGFDIPEGAHPLHLVIESSTGHRTTTVETEGIAEWRSAWEVIPRLHQTDIHPAPTVEFTWTVRPAPVVCVDTPSHDYTGSLYRAMPARAVAWHGIQGKPVFEEPPLERLGAETEIFHLGWPEHYFSQRGLATEALDERILAYLEALGRAPAKVVWTMHNRRPHAAHWHGERGTRFYRAMAAIADGVIHHSHWGMDLMRAELPYKESALHAVIPHGHFGEQMHIPQTRADLEAAYGLAPTVLRFGVLGRPQPEKQVELIAAAFMKAARPDQQLVITAYPFELDVSADPRIILLPREPWLTRQTIAGHVKLCDALVSAHTGDTYLTSGTTADSIGLGIPTLTNDWGYMREILGDTAFYHENTVDSLAALFASITAEQIQAGKEATVALQTRNSWSVVAAHTADFLRKVRLDGR